MRLKPPHIVLALAAFLAFPLAADETKEKTAEKPPSHAAGPAMKVYVDPLTGRIVPPTSEPDAVRGVPAATAADSSQPLRVEKVTAKAGGKKVNLQGRFVMEMAATVGPDGKIAQSCNQVPEANPGADAAAKERRHDR